MSNKITDNMAIYINNTKYTKDKEDRFQNQWVVTVELWLSLLPGVQLLAFPQHR